MSEYEAKLKKAKETYTRDDNELRVGFFGDKDIQKIHTALNTIEDNFTKAIEDNTDKNREINNDKFIELKSEIEAIQNKLHEGIELKDLQDIITKIAEIKVNPIINIPAPVSNVENKIVVQDWKKEFMFSDSDKTDTTTYVGFVNPSGGWYIERVTKSKSSDKARFVFGRSDYVSNWGKRLKQDYKLLFEVFNNGR